MPVGIGRMHQPPCPPQHGLDKRLRICLDSSSGPLYHQWYSTMIIWEVILALLLHAGQAGASERTSDLVDPSPGLFLSHRHAGLSL